MCDVIIYTGKRSTIIMCLPGYSLSMLWLYFCSKRVSTSLFVQCNVFGCMEYLGAVKYELRYRPNIGVRSDEQNNRNRKLIWRKSEIKLKLCVLA